MSTQSSPPSTTGQDPNGLNQHEPGAKLDGGKQKAWLVLAGFARALKLVVQVGTYGANKYSEDGWKSVPNGEKRYRDAFVRHLLDYMGGERLDPESKLPHLAHIAWNALALIQLDLPGSAGEVMQRLEEERK